MSPAAESSGVAQTFTKPQIIAHVEKSLDFTLYDAKWIPRSARFIVLGSRPRGTGTLQIYELTSGAGEVKKLTDVSYIFFYFVSISGQELWRRRSSFLIFSQPLLTSSSKAC